MKCRQCFGLFHFGCIVLAAILATAASAQPVPSSSNPTIRGLDSPDRIPGEYIVVLKEAPIQDYLETLPPPPIHPTDG